MRRRRIGGNAAGPDQPANSDKSTVNIHFSSLAPVIGANCHARGQSKFKHVPQRCLQPRCIPRCCLQPRCHSTWLPFNMTAIEG
jgi:hypothetical protein